MIDTKRLLKYIQRTNPNMDKRKLIEELSKSRYATVTLIIAAENIKGRVK